MDGCGALRVVQAGRDLVRLVPEDEVDDGHPPRGQALGLSMRAAREALEHPLVPLTWLANELSRTGIGLRAGEIFSSGTCTGMLRARPGETHVADFGAFGEVRVDFSS